MERRHTNRKKVNLKADIILEDSNHLGFVENVSEGGMHVISAPSRGEMDCTPGKILELKIHLPSNETLTLRCKIAWAYKTPHESLSSKHSDPSHESTAMGIEIIDPPQKFKEFVESLN